MGWIVLEKAFGRRGCGDEHERGGGGDRDGRPAGAAGRRGGAAPAVFNAANEQAVALFLDGRIRFGDIPRAIEGALTVHEGADAGSRDALLAADAAARRHVREAFRC